MHNMSYIDELQQQMWLSIIRCACFRVLFEFLHDLNFTFRNWVFFSQAGFSYLVAVSGCSIWIQYLVAVSGFRIPVAGTWIMPQFRLFLLLLDLNCITIAITKLLDSVVEHSFFIIIAERGIGRSFDTVTGRWWRFCASIIHSRRFIDCFFGFSGLAIFSRCR